MVQLKVFSDSTKSDAYYIDLYEESPIKLNFSIEDITNAEAKSVFSRTFRVPATGNNNLFFKFAFMIDDVDFDVTVKKPAEIYVNGAIFRQGHIRLQKIYNNKSQHRYDYEIIFLGETRDFASAIGDASLCALDMSDLDHNLTQDNIKESWRAYPANKSWNGFTIIPQLSNGLKNGQVIYPLIDFGDANPPTSTNPRIAVSGPHNFTNNDLPLNRFKPMVRAKTIVDKIFAQTNYSIEPGGFFDTTDFKTMYVSAFGNESTIDLNTARSNATFEAENAGGDQDGEGAQELYTIEIDPGNNFNLSTGVYTAPEDGTYVFEGSCYFRGDQTSQGQGFGDIELQIRASDPTSPNYNVWVTDTLGTGSSNGFIDVNNGGKDYDAGDEFRLYVEVDARGGRTEETKFECLEAPGQVNVAAQFDCDYKQIDFIKDLLTSFRLVMAPRRDDPTVFIIEPWSDYIASGEIIDWSSKLDLSTDVIIEPVFDTQTDVIMFDHEADEDYVNKYHRDAYKYTYGHLEFDSGNELLVGKRNIKTSWAPTPITQIDGADSTSAFVIPKLKVYDTIDDANGDPLTIGLPIKPKTRLLYYTGAFTAPDTWQLEDSSSDIQIIPLVSNSNRWPLVNSGKILNWFNDIGYWGQGVTGYPTQLGISMYNEYWTDYIQSLYNRNARRVTGTFILDDQDLRTFSFDDVIFLNGHYYQPEKITDATVGRSAKVKVQLIKLLNFTRPF